MFDALHRGAPLGARATYPGVALPDQAPRRAPIERNTGSTNLIDARRPEGVGERGVVGSPTRCATARGTPIRTLLTIIGKVLGAWYRR